MADQKQLHKVGLPNPLDTYIGKMFRLVNLRGQPVFVGTVESIVIFGLDSKPNQCIRDIEYVRIVSRSEGYIFEIRLTPRGEEDFCWHMSFPQFQHNDSIRSLRLEFIDAV